MAKALKSLGFSCLSVTDMLTTAGLTESIKAAQENDLKLLYGQRLQMGNSFAHLYPDNQQAFVWLNQLGSKILEDCSGKGKSELQFPGIMPFLDQLPVAGQGRILFSGDEEEAVLENFKQSGWQCLFKIPETLSISHQQKIREIALKFSMETIIAPDVSLVNKGQNKNLQLLRAIHNGNLFEESAGLAWQTPQYLDSLDWMKESFPKAYKANIEFCNQPSWTPELGLVSMPVFTPSREESIKLLRELSLAGLRKKYAKISEKIRQRFEYELNSIATLGFADYFLTVNEITTKAKELGVRVLGRGSAANSLISYVLDFTQVDPIKFDLYFERFLNPHRKSLPDVDLDFSWKIRDQIYQFLLEKWGKDRVAMISTHITMNTRSAIRETGKALGVSAEELNYLTSIIGHQPIKEFLEDPQLRSRYKPDMPRILQHRDMLMLAASIEGIPTHFSIHAGGVVISPRSLFHVSMLQPSSKVLPITHAEMHSCEKLGLVKLDLLSQRALGVYADVHENLQATNAPSIPEDPEKIEKDPKVSASLSKGETLGVFYIESPGMRGLLAKMKCKTFSELVAASSIIRPGVAESGMMQEYIKRHLRLSDWKPLHPLLKDVLAETYGIMVYQEDVMKVAHKIAGFSLAEADVLRRAMSGKERSSAQMDAAKERFLAGAKLNGIEREISTEIWRQISSFCGYAFCKAHSASYAVLSLQLLWMKNHFPGIYMAEVLNNRGGFYGPQAYISEAKRLGVKVIPPDVTLSGENFLVHDSTMLTGLSFISNLKTTTQKKIVAEREKKPFGSLEDFLARVSPSSDEWNNLVFSGSLHKFGSQAACRWKQKLSHQSELFSNDSWVLPAKLEAQEDRLKLIENELKSLGFAVSGHPIELFKWPEKTVPSTALQHLQNKQVNFAGLMIAAKSITTSKGEKMKFLTLEDDKGMAEIVFFPGAWKNNFISLEKAGVLMVSGVVKSDSGQLVIHGQKLRNL